jgi:hypothetical protein
MVLKVIKLDEDALGKYIKKEWRVDQPKDSKIWSLSQDELLKENKMELLLRQGESQESVMWWKHRQKLFSQEEVIS